MTLILGFVRKTFTPTDDGQTDDGGTEKNGVKDAKDNDDTDGDNDNERDDEAIVMIMMMIAMFRTMESTTNMLGELDQL